ncbi:WD40 repeat domain-containing protein [Sporobolomyces salmoneus]|uniref:WD40 repeat domain-containing protein n=1 Tax=Sporobolomyces salmoneus TaxID=183962 RepID=UPI00317A4750
MNPRKRTLDSVDLFLSNPATTRHRKFADLLFTSPFTDHSAYLAHHSCVNALAISPGEGRWLASGGDDKRVMIHEALANDDDGSLGEPRAWYKGAQSNIFAIDFDASGRKVYSSNYDFSAGNDAVILCHDLETSASSTSSHSPGGPSDVWIDNDDSVHGLACHPSNPNLFLSASSDGTLRQYDSRADTNAVGILADAHEMEGVAYHPRQHDLFAYSGEDAHAGLVDSRMAWSDTTRGPRSTRPRIAREVAVVNWQANLVRSGPRTSSTETDSTPAPRTRRARPAASSIAFSPNGNLVALTLSGHLPTVYTLSSPTPLATFSAPVPSPDPPETPSVPRSYRNLSTTKHGSFGGGPDAREGQGLFYAAGSDDFGVYIWEVPSRDRMEKGRTTSSFEKGDWPNEVDVIGETPPQTTFDIYELIEGRLIAGYLAPSSSTSPASLTFPHSINAPSSVLRTHRSIPNTTLFHPKLPYLYSCGVEKVIVRHSPATTSRSRTDSAKWSFAPRTPRAEPASFLSSLFGPTDSGQPTSLLPGESEEAWENRLRKEETEVLEYFDELISGEMDFEGVWRDAKEGEIDGVNEESSDDDDGGDEEDSEDFSGGEEEEERLEGEGDLGTTRRILNSIYALEEVDPSEDEEQGEDVQDEGSQVSLTMSEQAEYQQLMDASNDSAAAAEQGGSE